jgi:uncharacterized membrane protein
MPEEDTGNVYHLLKGRLESLSDGIFAFAMTLLVISLALPDKTSLIPSDYYALTVLESLGYAFLNYILAFLILGIFWLNQRTMFYSIRAHDTIFTWINLVMLMFVALLPFSTSYSGDFSTIPIGPIVLEANLFAIGICMSLLWWYASHGSRLIESTLKPEYIRNVSLQNLVVPGISILCIIFALVGNTWSLLLYLTLPIALYISGRFV